MLRICAWCKKELSTPAEGKTGPKDITHGICPDCFRQVISFEAQSLKDFLAQFSCPVLLMDADSRVITANEIGLKRLGKTNEQIQGQLGGDVFNCKHAKTEGGCGRTIHCKSCTIRKLILNTAKTGKSHCRVPAYPDLNYITGENTTRFLISTEKIDEAVLLKVEEVAEEPSLPKTT